jgi:hypothetical protein
MIIHNKRRKIKQRNKILVESFIAGVSFAIIILGLMFLAYGLQA